MLINPEHLKIDIENISILRPEEQDWQRPLMLAAIGPISRSDVELLNFQKPERNIGDAVPKKAALVAGMGAAALFSTLPIGAVHAQEQFPPSPTMLMPSIVMTGDSITVGSVEAGNLKEKFQAAGINVSGLDYKGSRPLVWQGCDQEQIDKICREISDGIRGLERMSGPLASADVAVIALGTNTPLERFEVDFERNVRLAHTISNTDGTPAVIAAPEMFYTDDSYTGSAQQKNDILHRMSERLSSEGIQLVILPVVEAGIPLSDGIHPQWDKYDDLAQLLASQVAPMAYEHKLKDTTLSPSLPEGPINLADIDIQNFELPTNVNSFHTPQASADGNSLERLFGDAIELPKRIFGRGSTIDQGPRINISTLDTSLALADFTTEGVEDTAIKNAFKLHESTAISPPANDGLIDRLGRNIPDIPVFDSLPIIQDLNNPNISMASLAANPDLASKILSVSSAGEIVANTVTEVPAVQAEAPESTSVLAEQLRGLNTVTQDGRFDSARLIEHISNTFRRPDPNDKRFPAGYFRWDNIPGLPIELDENVTDAERYASAGTMALIVNIGFKYQELQQKYPELQGVNIKLGDLTSRHKEHQHGGDFDLLLIPQAQASEELFLHIISLRAADGSEEVEHIITGDEDLENVGDDYLVSMNYERPNIIVQDDHGETASGYNHWHISRDGGSSSSDRELERSDVELNDSNPVLTTEPINPDILNPVPTNPIDQLPHTPGNSKGRININELNIDWGNLVGGTNRDDAEIDVPAPVDDQISIIDLVGRDPDVDNQEGTSSTIIELPDNYTDDGLTEEDDAVAPPPVTEPVLEPEAPEAPAETPAPPGNAYGVDAPLLDIFAPEAVQLILPEADPNNILNYTPIIMRALNEFSLADLQMACYALATINPETSTMAPIEEIGRGHGKEYGFWYGRGFIQLTWQSNYEAAGAALGIDLINYPELALEPNNSARIMAWFLKNREGDIRDALNNGDMRRARQIVNGEAAHGLSRFRDSYITCDNIT